MQQAECVLFQETLDQFAFPESATTHSWEKGPSTVTFFRLRIKHLLQLVLEAETSEINEPKGVKVTASGNLAACAHACASSRFS